MFFFSFIFLIVLKKNQIEMFLLTLLDLLSLLQDLFIPHEQVYYLLDPSTRFFLQFIHFFNENKEVYQRDLLRCFVNLWCFKVTMNLIKSSNFFFFSEIHVKYFLHIVTIVSLLFLVWFSSYTSDQSKQLFHVFRLL